MTGMIVEILLHRQMNIGHGLRLHALRRVDDQQRPFARAQAARNFIGKITCPGVSIRFNS